MKHFLASIAIITASAAHAHNVTTCEGTSGTLKLMDNGEGGKASVELIGVAKYDATYNRYGFQEEWHWRDKDTYHIVVLFAWGEAAYWNAPTHAEIDEHVADWGDCRDRAHPKTHD